MVKRRTVKAPKGRQPRPVATLGGLVGIWLAGLDLGIYGQIGLVMLAGLASKNAILIVEFARDEQVRRRIVFLENYEIGVASLMVSGVDLWLNTPTRPLEADGFQQGGSPCTCPPANPLLVTLCWFARGVGGGE